MGNNPYYYDSENSFPRYENSFYFYFGLKAGKTAIEKFNSKYFAECNNSNAIQTQIGVRSKANSWCSKIGVGQEDKDKGYNTNNDGYLALDLTGISTPYKLLINSETNSSYSIEINDIVNEKIILMAKPHWLGAAHHVLNGTELAITNKRVIGKIGRLGAQVMDTPLNKINNVKVGYNLLGKILKAGAIQIATQGGETYDFIAISNPNEFKKVLNQAIEDFDNARIREQAEMIAAGIKK